MLTEQQKKLQQKLRELDVLNIYTPPVYKAPFFANDDVPVFLKKLDEFEKKSREHSLKILSVR